MLIEVNAFPPPDKSKIKNEFFVLAGTIRQAIVAAESYPIVVPVDTRGWLEEIQFQMLKDALDKAGWYITRKDYSTEAYNMRHCIHIDEKDREAYLKKLPPYTYSYTLEPTKEVILSMIKEFVNVR